MDDSLKDFQKPKKGSKGPKINNKTKEKKGKKPRGQSDIRVALRQKKNELIAYNNDFNEVCREGGVDVDSEQLQIAIAMSKSLQENTVDSVQSSGSSKVRSMSSQERCNKIRTTLLEYGFHVPDIKINTIGKRKKGKRKPSKLLLMSENERQQLISDKYSQILFNMGSNIKKDYNIKKYGFIFDISTNKCYEYLKNDHVFYLDKLFSPSNNDICCLLRDWSEIPGRPKSPICKEKYDIKFSDVSYTQEELDVILSGRLNVAKNIIKSKQNNITNQEQTTEIFANIYNTDNNAETTIEKEINKSQKKTNITLVDATENSNEITEFGKYTIVRSLSPDMFDDSELVETNTSIIKVNSTSTKAIDIQLTKPSRLCDTNNKSQDFMDLTECIKPNNTSDKNIPYSENSEKNFTRRKSDDFMDLTECIKPNILNPISKIVEEPIDLTQNFNENEKAVDVNGEGGASLDLTQSSDSNDSTLPYVDIKGPISGIINKVILSNNTIDDHNKTNSLEEISSGSMVDDFSDKVLLSRLSSEVSIFDDFLYSHSDHSSKNSEKNNLKKSCSLHETNSNINDDNNVDLTQNSTSSEDISNNKDSCSSTLNYQRSELILKELLNQDIKERSAKNEDLLNKSVKITDFNNTDSYNNTFKTLTNISKLGKYNNESIDYSEEYCSSNKDELSKMSSLSNEKSNDQTCEDKLNVIKHCSQLSSSQCSSSDIVFEISDEELDYSMHKSKLHKDNPLDNYDNNLETGVILLNNDNILNNTKRTTLNNSINISLPAIEIKGTKVKIKSPVKLANIKELTPIKTHKNDIIESIETPKNSNYIIKTNNITPMINYESLSTPEVNQELNKYGLKTFKRKRAIQLLQHLYNQTHPIVENCIQDEVSFRKKFKPNIIETTISEDNNPSSSNNKLVNKLENNSKDKIEDFILSNEDENVLYEVTEELPDLKDVQCHPDDWVFQKKEKARLHTCRVPLHIIFHNYVSCRHRLREAILCYHPIQIDIIHKQLVTYGYKFHPKDLLKYMDKKCITVKTSDNNARNSKRSQTKGMSGRSEPRHLS